MIKHLICIKKPFIFMLYFCILNFILAAVISLSYAPSEMNFTTFAYFLLADLSLIFLFLFALNFIFVYPCLILSQKYNLFILFFACLIDALFLIVLSVDVNVFKLYRFHLSYAMLDLFFNTDVISFNLETWLGISFKILGIVLYTILAYFVASLLTQKLSKRFLVIFTPLILASYLVANLIHAFAFAKADVQILDIQNHLPFYKPLTMNSFLRKIGYISNENAVNVNLTNKGGFDYPKNKLKYDKNTQTKYNILILAIDSLRYDMLNAKNMPFTYEFSKNALVFHQHYSSSNSTRGGIFGLFYGIAPIYWQLALSNQKPAALITAAQENDYDLAIFATATLTKPEFDRTIFASVPYLRLKSKGANTIEADENSIEDFKEFMDKRNKDRGFLGFIFLDNVHAKSFPKDFEIFKPSKNTNYLDLSADTDATPYFNFYQNAVLYADFNIQKILNILETYKELDNTIIIITSDHGEEFNEDKDNFWGHNSNFKDFQVKIPLIIKYPKILAQNIYTKSSAYDISATLMQEVFGVINPIKDYSLGQNLFNLKDRKFLLAGSYNQNAILENERIILIDSLGLIHFKDKVYKDSKNTSRDAYLLEILKDFSYYRK